VRTLSRRITALACIFLVASVLSAQTVEPDNKDSCIQFVQSFYDWYVSKAIVQNRERPWHLAAKHGGKAFDDKLTQALAKSDAEVRSTGDAVLDFDPILNTQDPAERYVIREVTRKDGHCLANVYGVWSRSVPDQGKKPQVVAEIAFENGRWLFVNFHYPNSSSPKNENLLSILSYHDHR
jgi:hypothetical protein